MRQGLCLASQSPRRAELLRQAGFDFWTYEPKVDESALEDERPAGTEADLFILIRR